MAVQMRSQADLINDRMLTLLELSRQARAIERVEELDYLIVNSTHRLAPYRQAVLWRDAHRPTALSGLMSPDANAPMIGWLADLHRDVLSDLAGGPVDIKSLTEEDQAAWQEYLPPFALWLPEATASEMSSGLLLVREMAWTEQESTLVEEWWQVWAHAQRALQGGGEARRRLTLQRVKQWLLPAERPWHRKRLTWIVAALLLLMLFPVRMTVIAPGQLVPVDPLWVRAPIEGVVAEVLVSPTDRVEAGDPLFRFDDEVLASRVEVSRQALSTATAQYQQLTQQALGDEEFGAELIEAAGAVEQKRAELTFLESRLNDSTVRAERDGVAIFDSASGLVGQPVGVGERIMRIVDPGKSEIEAWLPVADAVDLPPGSPVNLYLRSAPLSPVSGEVRYVAYDATERPSGNVAYRVRASLDQADRYRVGLKGTSRLSGGWTTLGYWLLRRPIASLRTRVGV
ncbi:efflux RND transporter periplasmic adaptor subunit [Spiribacter salinus]|uniref:efflux RND transporter periplasmic adaptor subunit n=1 Tax=Spiribacter salinus TaxID=1335746 RepID=UPI001C967277|nr:HlyD family efflux transporter periplasmic adaptor subunit [Spiribacter salinus]